MSDNAWSRCSVRSSPIPETSAPVFVAMWSIPRSSLRSATNLSASMSFLFSRVRPTWEAAEYGGGAPMDAPLRPLCRSGCQSNVRVC
jgi:hypothetical protein